MIENQYIVIEPSGVGNPQISVVICSIDRKRYDECRKNISETIGVDAEFIRINNAAARWPIAKAYNNGAMAASSPNLLFIHEDVRFENSGWGKNISSRLAEPSTGVIGFIGTTIRLGAYAGWSESPNHVAGHMYYIQDGRRLGWHEEPWENGKMIGSDFARVLVVDGLGFAVRRDVWESNRFDETVLDGFHCYDIDFCLQVARNYKNYVYLKAEITHFSNGNMKAEWVETTIKLTDGKWSKLLPAWVEGYEPDDKNFIMAHAEYDFAFKAFRERANRKQSNFILRRYIKKSLHSPLYAKWLPTLLWQYLIKWHKMPH